MTVLSSSYCIIMDCVHNALGHGNNVVDGLNSTDKHYLKGEMEIIGKLGSNNSTNIGMLPSASKHVSVNFPDMCVQLINDK